MKTNNLQNLSRILKDNLNLKFKKMFFFLCFIVGGFFVLGAGNAKAIAQPVGTYYICQAGSGTGDGSTVDNCRSIVNHNSDTFTSPSTIYLIDAMTSIVIPPSSGSSDVSRIIYRGDLAGHAGVMNCAGKDRCIYISGKNYLSFVGLALSNAIRNIESAGSTTGITIQQNQIGTSTGTNAASIWAATTPINWLVTENTFTGGEDYILVVLTGTTFSVTNNTFSSCVAGNYGNYFTSGGSSVNFSGNTISGFTTAGTLNYFGGINGLTFSSNTIGNASSPSIGNGVRFDNVSNLASYGNNVSYVAGRPFYISGITTGTMANDTASYATGSSGSGYNGFYWEDTANTTCTNCVSHHNDGDGFSTNVSAIVNCYKCLSYNNGSIEASGDGYTSHNASVFNLYYSAGHSNKKSGAAMTGSGNGEIHNCNFYNNYDETISDDLGIYINSSGTWSIKDNIMSHNRTEAFVAGVGVFNFSNNLYWDDRNLGGNNFYYINSTYDYANFIAANQETNPIHSSPFFTSPSDFHLQPVSPAIDAGTSVSLTSDCVGNPIYGTPDIGAYEYQPPHTVGTDKIDIGAGARIYGDGKFRDLNTTSSELADLTITPQTESFETYESDEVRPEWLNITNITWNETKEWTESIDSALTNTLHTVGDLTPHKYYNISVDDVLGQNIIGDNCINGICKSDSNGKIVFTYNGTYSEHTFKVEAGDNSNPTLTNNTNNKFYTNTTSVTLSLTTDENSICHYSNNSSTTFDNATAFTVTGEITHSVELTNLTSGNYLYYAICRDSNSNESSYTLSFEIAPEELKEKISSPIIKTGEGKEKMKSNSTVHSNEKEIKLQGEDIKLANGTIKIYRNSKLIKTILVDEKGKWSKKIKLDKDFNGYLKVKLYNQYGTLLNEKKTKVKVDNEKPEITIFPKNLTSVTRGKTNITWEATDNNKVTSYKIYLGGNVYKTKTNSFMVPAKTEKGMQYLRIRAYDKAGNSSYREAFVLVR